MTDLDLIRDLRPDVRLADADELAPARGQLAAAIATEISGQSTASAPAPVPAAAPAKRAGDMPGIPRRGRSFWQARRLAPAGVAATAVAAGVAAALIVVPGHGGQPAPQPAVTSGRARHVMIHPVAGHLTAARFLHAAARAALQLPAAPPRPSQFVYSESEGPGGTSKYQIWQSADGTRPGLVVSASGPPSPLTPCTVAQAEARRCRLQVGYLPGLPTRAGAVLAYLTKIGLIDPTARHKPIPNWVANDVGKEVDSLLSNTYLLPAQRAALFESMARTPGFTVAPRVVDAIGRPGVGIEWKYQGGTVVVIFSKHDYSYLGDEITLPGLPKWASALVKFAVVDSLPPHA